MKSWQIDIRVCQCCLYLGNKKMLVMVKGGGGGGDGCCYGITVAVVVLVRADICQ